MTRLKVIALALAFRNPELEFDPPLFVQLFLSQYFKSILALGYLERVRLREKSVVYVI